MATAAKLLTAEDLERMPASEAPAELVRGEIIGMTPAGFEHARIAARISFRLSEFAGKTGLGSVCTAEGGFVLSRGPDTVRAPDVAFVSAERAARQIRPEAFFEGAPDLAVEVVSPNDPDDLVQAKVLDYLAAGARLVWIVRPRTATVTVYRSLSDVRVLTTAENLDGSDLLPSFTFPVRAIFEP